MGDLITLDTPPLGQPQIPATAVISAPQLSKQIVFASLPTTPLSFLFQDALSSLWLIWELCTLSEPVSAFVHLTRHLLLADFNIFSVRRSKMFTNCNLACMSHKTSQRL